MRRGERLFAVVQMRALFLSPPCLFHMNRRPYPPDVSRFPVAVQVLPNPISTVPFFGSIVTKECCFHIGGDAYTKADFFKKV